VKIANFFFGCIFKKTPLDTGDQVEKERSLKASSFAPLKFPIFGNFHHHKSIIQERERFTFYTILLLSQSSLFEIHARMGVIQIKYLNTV